MPSDRLALFHAALPLLDQLPSEVLSVGNAYEGLPAPNSQAGREQATLAELRVPETAFSHVNILLMAAGNGLAALNRALTEPVLTLAPWGLARSVLESSTVAAWLLEPDISVEERARRSLNVRVRDIRREEEYWKSLERDRAPSARTEYALRHLKERLDQIAQQGSTLGFSPHSDRSGWLRHVGEAGVPGTTRLTREMFGREDIWHLLSAAEHGRSWATLALGSRAVQPSARSGVSLVEEALPVELALWLINYPLAWFTRPAWNRAALSGWPLARLATVLGEAARVLALHPAHKFWADARTAGGTTVLSDLTIGVDLPPVDPP